MPTTLHSRETVPWRVEVCSQIETVYCHCLLLLLQCYLVTESRYQLLQEHGGFVAFGNL